MTHLSRETMIAAATLAPLAILRPTMVFGHDDTHNSYGPNRFFREAQRSRRITVFGRGEETRDHIFIGDVVALTLLVLQHRTTGVLNLATGTSVTYRSLAEKIARLFDQPITIAEAPRVVPITHRQFDVGHIRRLFPSFVFTLLDTALATVAKGRYADIAAN